MPIVKTTERAMVDLPPGSDVPAVRRRLMRAGRVGNVPAFEARNGRLHALDVVGVVDVGTVVVEIAPKTEAGTVWNDGASLLRHLLDWLGREDPFAVPSGQLHDGESLFESALAWAARSMAALLEDGPPRRYAEIEERSASIKGRIVFSGSARRRPGQALVHTIRHAPLSTDNELTAVLMWIALEIGRRTSSIRTRSSCERIVHGLSDAVSGPAEPYAVVGIELTRMEEHWSAIVEFGRALARGAAPDPSRGGASTGVAMLFTLKDLFEAAIGKVLKDGLPNEAMAAVRPRGKLFIAASGGTSLVRLEPDFGAARTADGDPKVVGDAKWKRIVRTARAPDLSPADAYQITSYVAATKAEAGFVVAPLSEDDPRSLVVADYRIRGLDVPMRIVGVRFAKLVEPSVDGECLRRELCRAVARMAPVSSPL